MDPRGTCGFFVFDDDDEGVNSERIGARFAVSS
jgi:hypothetical protein